jgi:hypothetical protein
MTTQSRPPADEVAAYLADLDARADRWERNTGLDWHSMPIADDDWDVWKAKREGRNAS